ncbi:uncharacterized protein LOC144128153 isoform X2 [Amblyomma americanum]
MQVTDEESISESSCSTASEQFISKAKAKQARKNERERLQRAQETEEQREERLRKRREAEAAKRATLEGAQCSQQKTEKCCCYGWHCNLKGEAKHVQKALCKKQRHQHLFTNAWQKHADRNLHKDKQSDANGKAYARTSNADIRSPDDISGCTTSSMFSA